jgi:hypothetical protein
MSKIYYPHLPLTMKTSRSFSLEFLYRAYKIGLQKELIEFPEKKSV